MDNQLVIIILMHNVRVSAVQKKQQHLTRQS